MYPIPIATLILTFLVCIINLRVVVTKDVDENHHHHINDPDDDQNHKPANGASQTEPLKLYGTEVSWPMQQLLPLLPVDVSETITTNMYPTYMEYMNCCYETYNIQTCQQYDTIRIQRNNIQPRTVHQNYTRAGYAKVLAPSTTFSLLRDYWNRYSTTHLQFESNQGMMNDGSGTTTSSSGGYSGKENIDLYRDRKSTRLNSSHVD